LVPGMDVVTTLFWSIDLLIIMMKGKYVRNHLTHDCHGYWRSWGVFDLGLVVLDWVLLSLQSVQASLASIVRAGRVLRFFRLLRLVKARRRSQSVAQAFRSLILMQALRFCNFLLMLLGTVHVLACAWVSISRANSASGPSWVGTLSERDGIYNSWYQWLAALHWAVCQLHGAMEIHAHNVHERVFALGVGVAACVFYPLVISSVTASVVRLRKSCRESGQKRML
jgi:hypothetical protein